MEEKLFFVLKSAIRDFVKTAHNGGWEERKIKKVIRHMMRDALKKYTDQEVKELASSPPQ